ncbi:LOW QUALITY PROTEIN: hypothetical protein MXB_1354 [Myxobolus squamalis]|nr:LOW QUALITY PROTEIN: hypothetical protein MXB_1354 [Myxobolus squamalis]
MVLLDLTQKSVDPVGGFVHYKIVSEAFLILKDQHMVLGNEWLFCKKTIHPQITHASEEKITLKFIDTSSKL